MNSITKPMTILENRQVPVQAKLAAAWTSFMFLYIYVDHLGLYKPGHVDGILNGLIWKFDVSATLLTIILVSVSIPALMVVLSIDAARSCEPRHKPRRSNALHPVLSVQRGRGDLGVGRLLRPLHRNRGAAPGLHPALRLGLAPPGPIVDARPHRTQPVADSDRTVGTWLRSEPRV